MITTAEGEAIAIDVKTGTSRSLGRFDGRLYKVAISPDARAAALACSDGNAYLVDLATVERRALTGHHREVNAVAFSADGRLVATASDDRTVRTFDAATGAPRWGAVSPPPAPPPRADLPPDPGAAAALRLGDREVIGFDNGAVEVRPRPGDRDGAVLLRDTPTGAVTILAPGPSSTLAAGFEDGTLGVWDPATGRLLDRARLHGAVVSATDRSGAVVAESELGDRAEIDLTLLGRGYCDVMADVWRAIPFVWQAGAPRIEPPPPTHPCALREHDK